MQVNLCSLADSAVRAIGAVRAVFLVAAVLVLFSAAAIPARAQYGMPESPAFASGQRLQGQAEAAWNTAAALDKAGNFSQASGERQTARDLATQAIKQYGVVVQSATYRHTAVAAEATLFWARLLNNIQQDPEQAILIYQQLDNNYSGVNYPDKAVGKQEVQVVARAVDLKYRTTPVLWFHWWFFKVPFPSAAAYEVMHFLVALTGSTSQSYWLAIVMISAIVKLGIWGLSAKQFKSLKETQKLQPYIKELQAKYKNDREVLGRKMMELYAEHGINPMAGCAPLVIQLPVMYLLYNTIRIYQYQFQHGTFLWIGSPLAKLYPSVVGMNLGVQDIPLLGLYMLSMYVQMRMTTPPDPQQAEQQRMMAIYMPFVMGFTFLQYHWPSAFVLYYLVFNLLSMLQQQWYMKERKKDDALGTVAASTAVSTDEPGPKYGQNGAGGEKIYGNGAKPAAKGAISPKVHPKKKRR